ncbi:phosphotransferase [Thalassotalea sp. 1_MG-2023]|uniref:phosphotransferase n=1 Tax=Thalassotalea sp. 1_MG-2023 TaxID=3062680 RepID=UPI0026E2B59F|nr:phosphotransferase [Thalassotalea sp. 1_MG-2023]MDO6425521.1 phosphotransferase [Thalassotalea sp. 1_MG-2023]
MMNSVDIDRKEVVNNTRQLTCFASLPCSIDFINQGLSHNNVKVTTFDRHQQVSAQYFVKWFNSDAQTALHEIASAKLAMQHGLAPKIVYSSDECFVTEFIQGESLQSLLSKQPSQLSSAIRQTAVLLAQLHQIPANNSCKPFDIHALLTTLTADCNVTASQANEISQLIAQFPRLEHSNAPVICHGDANFSNVLVDITERYWLIDYECSIFTDAEFDIAMCIAINQLDDHAISIMQHVYQQHSGCQLSLSLVNTYQPYCALINALWFIAKAKKSPQETILLKHAEQQLTRIEAYTTPCLLEQLFTHST